MKKYLSIIFLTIFISHINSQWRPSSSGMLPIPRINAIFINDSVALIGLKDMGIYTSTNNGIQWVEKNNNLLITPTVYSFEIFDNNIFAGSTSGILKSTNNGNNWSISNNGLPSNTVIRSLLKIDSVLFAGSYSIYTSTNMGNNWTLSNLTLPYTINSIFKYGNKIFAGSGKYISGCAIHQSTNNGLTWFCSDNGIFSSTRECYINSIVASGQKIFAGTTIGGYVSSDSGSTWTGLSGLITYFGAVGNNIIMSIQYNGLYLSTNSGETWVQLNTGFSNVCSFAGNNSYWLLGADSIGIYKSSDNGINWVSSNYGCPGIPTVKSLYTIGSNMYAGTQKNGIYKSTDGGNFWFSINDGIPVNNTTVCSIVSDSINLYAGVYGEGGVYKSTNWGTSWVQINGGNPLFVYYVRTLIVKDSFLFAGLLNYGAYRSNNYGLSWEQVNYGMISGSSIKCFAVNDEYLFGGSGIGRGIYRTADNGLNWTIINNGLNTTVDLNEMTVSSGNVFAGFNGYGIYVTTNNGLSWSAVNNGIGGTSIYGRALASDLNNNIYAGIAGKGFFKTSNNGALWLDYTYNLIGKEYINNILVFNNYVFVGTEYQGISKINNSQLVSAKNLSKSVLKTFSLSQNFPNPFNPLTKIRFSIPLTEGARGRNVFLIIYDVLGREVQTLVNEKLSPGTYEVEWNGTNYPSGVYYYTLTVRQAGSSTGDFIQTKKMVLLK